MPFGKRKRDGKFQVINTETGDVKGTHDTEADADKQLAALHANGADKDRKDKGFMDIHYKAVSATIEDTSSSEDEFPGTFTVELSNETTDRDGETLKASDWETPLPERITFVNDHTHKMASVVGSAVPELDGDRIVCKGEWGKNTVAQETRKIAPHVPYVSVAYHEKSNGRRELINGSFVVVPSNPTARLLASKGIGDDDAEEFLRGVVAKAVEDSMLKLKSILAPSDQCVERLKELGLEVIVNEEDSTLTVKSHGNTLGTHKFSPSTAPGTPDEGLTTKGTDTAEGEAALLQAAAQIASKATV